MLVALICNDCKKTSAFFDVVKYIFRNNLSVNMVELYYIKDFGNLFIFEVKDKFFNPTNKYKMFSISAKRSFMVFYTYNCLNKIQLEENKKENLVDDFKREINWAKYKNSLLLLSKDKIIVYKIFFLGKINLM